jgi:hypothetical protein
MKIEQMNRAVKTSKLLKFFEQLRVELMPTSNRGRQSFKALGLRLINLFKTIS